MSCPFKQKPKLWMRIIICLAVLIAPACSVNNMAIQTNQTPTHSELIKIASSPTPSPQLINTWPVDTLVPTDIEVVSFFENLPLGQFLVINDESCNLWAFDIKKGDPILLATGICAFDRDPRIAGDYSIAYSNYDRKVTYLVNLRTHNRKTYELEECKYPSWSPDLTHFVVGCGLQCLLYSVEKSKYSVIVDYNVDPTDYTKNSYCLYADWSPDGSKIFINRRNLSGMYPSYDDGIYLVNGECITNPGSCVESINGPLMDSIETIPVYTWSNDSKKITIAYGSLIEIYDIGEHQSRYIKTDTIGLDSIAWSLNDKIIAFSTEGSVYYLPSNSSEQVRVPTTNGWNTVIGWITTYPLPEFKVDGKYIITSIPERLNFRVQPSLLSSVDFQLIEGDKLEFIEGPVVVDNATWWKAKLSNQMVGWVMENKYWYTPDVER